MTSVLPARPAANILYMAPDLSDPAVARRRAMLQTGGAEVALAGFVRNTADAPPEAWRAENLGRTQDADLVQRALSVILNLLQPWRLRRRVLGRSVVIARNLEMLVLACAGLWLAPGRGRLAYEVLDVHRIMLGEGFISRALRFVEGVLLRRVDLLLLSSAGFDRAYFEPLQPTRTPRVLVENKVLVLADTPPTPPAAPATSARKPIWRIGWFGMLRCERSIELLGRLAARRPGLIEIDIRGRPSPAIFGPDFESVVRKWPGLTFHGPYKPEDLADAYAAVHFVWGMDFYEAGQNSDWLLPNRLYEGSAHGRPLLAQRDVETGRWLAVHGAGVLFGDVEEELTSFFDALTPSTYDGLAKAVARIPRSDLIADRDDCRQLVRLLVESTE